MNTAAIAARHVAKNSCRQWLAAVALCAAVFAFFMWYHAVRGRPYSLFVANKCVGIAAAFLTGLALALGPLARRWPRWQRVLPHRRSLGLVGAYACMPHALVSTCGSGVLGFPRDGQFTWSWHMAHWPCGVSGALALALLLLITMSSYPCAMRRLGPERWLRLQRLGWALPGLLIAHLAFKGTAANWLKWLQTFDKPFPPGAMTTTAFLALVLMLKWLDRAIWRRAMAVGLVAFLALGCSRSEPPGLRVLCGSSMAVPMQELAPQFTRETGIAVEFDLGGSETLLPKILAGTPADIYVCHDPFEEKIRAANRWAGSCVVGHLQPVLAVRPGNPGQVRTLADLQRADLRIGIGDPRYSTCGELFVDALRQRGLYEGVMRQVVLQARSTTDVANGLAAGPLDVAVVWNFSLNLYTGKLEQVKLDVDLPAVRVTVLGLTGSPHPEARDQFLGWCDRPEVHATFRRHRYVKGPS